MLRTITLAAVVASLAACADAGSNDDPNGDARQVQNEESQSAAVAKLERFAQDRKQRDAATETDPPSQHEEELTTPPSTPTEEPPAPSEEPPPPPPAPSEEPPPPPPFEEPAPPPAPPPPPAPGEVAVLLIGNSQLGNFSNTPQPPDVTVALEALSQVAHGGSHRMIVDRAQVGGVGCDGFLNNGTYAGTPRERAGSGDYDYVVLLPSLGETSRNDACWDAFREIAEGAGAEFVMMATASLSGAYPGGFDALDSPARSYALDHGLIFVPGGDTWRQVLGDNPGSTATLEMYSGDDAHPGTEGSYLYTLALYGALSGTSVVGLPIDIAPLRCVAGGSCLSYEALDACVRPDGDSDCAPTNGMVFDGNGKPTFIDAAEAATYQAAVDAVLAAR
ncbi:MAG: hypothetical protein Q8O67_26030 [Deltaproteobacteria bacterium]|nr:hypothetical protein [Deltaproteobacteria bacterium]